MELNAELDFDVVALEADDEVTCLLTLKAPVPAEVEGRPGETIVAVVDRSGSMSGPPLDAVVQSLHMLADRLKPQDSFGVVVFDDQSEISVPVRAARDHDLPTVHALLNSITPGGSTDLSAGYLLGLEQARRAIGPTGATVLLLSDGHANAGIVDPAVVGGLAAKAQGERITTATIGVGAGYDEVLLAELATQGRGSHRFAYTPDDAIAVVGEEAGDILAKAIVNAFARITPSQAGLLERIGLIHQTPCWVEESPTGVQRLLVPLGDLYAGETRELLLRFGVPALAELGPTVLAHIDIDYVALPSLTSQQITWPVAVNVVSTDEASGRIPRPTVRTARLLAESAGAKAMASEALRNGNRADAISLIEAEDARLAEAAACLDGGDPAQDAVLARLAEERMQMGKLRRAAEEQATYAASKSFMEDAAFSLQGRGSDTGRRQRSRNKRSF